MIALSGGNPDGGGVAVQDLNRGREEPERRLDSLAEAIRSAMFSLHVWIYFEWVESKANWADAISREGAQDPWCNQHGFKTAPASFPRPSRVYPSQP